MSDDSVEDEIMGLAPLADMLERIAMAAYGEEQVRNEMGVEGKTVPELVDEYRKSEDSTEKSAEGDIE